MSRGFVKEEDQEEAPMVPPRAALPDGEINYVTPNGMEALTLEKTRLEEERRANATDENETERRRANMLIDGKLKLLNERINSARVLALKDQPKDEVRFGATATLLNLSGPLKGKTLKLQIVGVDEADVAKQKVSFLSPLAKAVLGKKVGEEGTLHLGAETRKVEVKAIDYN